MTEPLTSATIVSRLPEEIVDLVGRFIGDSDIDTDLDEVKVLMPASPVVSAIASYLGISQESPSGHALDQAKAWIDEQSLWQDRSSTIQQKLSEKFPFTEVEASKGEIPSWMHAPWAPTLLFQWSEALRDAVLQAEEYVEEVL
jgi:hypothetical protein